MGSINSRIAESLGWKLLCVRILGGEAEVMLSLCRGFQSPMVKLTP